MPVNTYPMYTLCILADMANIENALSVIILIRQAKSFWSLWKVAKAIISYKQIVHQTNSNAPMDNAFLQVRNVTDILNAWMEVTNSVVVSS